MKKHIPAVLALSAALLLGLGGCGAKTEEAQSGADSETAAAGIAVQVKQVVAENLATDNKVSGRITAEDEATVMVAATAKCTAVYVKAGDVVQKGDVLCRLDLGSTLSSYSAAQISYEAAVKSYNDQKVLLDEQVSLAEQQIELLDSQIAFLEQTLENTKALFEIGAASQLEIDTLQIQQLDPLRLQRTQAQTQLQQLKSTRDSTLSQLQAGIESARSGVQQLDTVLQDVDSQGNVIAPMSGTLVTFTPTENNFISSAMPVAVIEGEAQMKITASVSEALVPKIASGETADIFVSAVNRSFTAEIRSVERSANVQTRLYTVTLMIPEEESGDLLSGMSADVTFHTDRVESAIVAPSEAILTSGDTQYVYIVENGDTARYVEVTTGLSGTGVTEILTGLKGGEMLVTVGQSYLNDGDPVRVVS